MTANKKSRKSSTVFAGYLPDTITVGPPPSGIERIKRSLAYLEMPPALLRKFVAVIHTDRGTFMNPAVTFVERTVTNEEAHLHLEFARMEVVKPVKVTGIAILDHQGQLVREDSRETYLMAGYTLVPNYSLNS